MAFAMVQSSVRGAMEIEAELRAPSAQVRRVRYHFPEPPESTLHVEGKFRVELALTARHRSARACFRDYWNPHRFERIGPMFIVPPDMDVAARSDESSSASALVCELDAAPVLELFDEIPAGPTDRQLRACLDIHVPAARKLMLRLAEEARHPGFASEMLVESIATQISVELFRHGAEILERPPHGSGLAPWQLRRIDERLREIREAPTLLALAELCRLSIRQLTRGFRASRGQSLGAYVAASQMEHAKTLLARGASVASIADTLGFASSSNFCFAFRRAMGVTPGQFREMLRH